ncbi:MAG TPA: PUA domain-containing protein [Candidatus Bathyarchaeia archaeon]|nr:PUA domain-containing protein [Candidatus Bathyarchaeia archaeon]
MSANQRLVFPEFLSESLSRVYDGRLQEIMNSLGRMGDRYYFRLNTLAAYRWDILAEMRRMHPDVGQHEFLNEAAYLSVRESILQPKGSFVEADPFAAEAVLHGAHLYAPGVRKCSEIKIGKDASVTDPSGILAGTGVAVRSETSILTNRQGIAVKIENSKYGLPSLMETEPYAKGHIHLQSLPAMVTCLALDPQPNETIVDLNCAPGGKLSYICQLTENRARTIGFDRNEQKIDRAARTVERLKCANYRLIAHDSRYAHIDYNLKADRVLVDPPSTALGVTPKLSIRTGANDITNLSSYQKQFLTTAAALVKKGGTVVYSVCTISLEECEEMSRYAEDELGLEQVEATPRLGHGSIDGYRLCQRFDPALDGTGYFIAKFIKN